MDHARHVPGGRFHQTRAFVSTTAAFRYTPPLPRGTPTTYTCSPKSPPVECSPSRASPTPGLPYTPRRVQERSCSRARAARALTSGSMARVAGHVALPRLSSPRCLALFFFLVLHQCPRPPLFAGSSSGFQSIDCSTNHSSHVLLCTFAPRRG